MKKYIDNCAKRALGFYAAALGVSILFPGIGLLVAVALVNRGKKWTNLMDAAKEIDSFPAKELDNFKISEILRKHGVDARFIEF